MKTGEPKSRKVLITVIITVLVIVLLVGGYLLLKNYENKRLSNAFSYGYNKSLMDVAQGQTQTGSILTWGNNTIQIMGIDEICTGIGYKR